MKEAAAVQTEDKPKKKYGKIVLICLAVLAYIAFQIWAARFVEPNMDRVTHHPHNLEEIFGWHIPFGGVNMRIIGNTWLVMGIMILLGFLGARRLRRFPGRRQGAFEALIEGFRKLSNEALGEDLGRKVVPYIMTLFFFVMLCNWLLVLYVIPWIAEPTLNLNTTLGLAMIAFFVSHGIAIKEKGFFRYIKHYFEPFIKIGTISLPNIFFFPLHVIGEVGKLISHSVRLFGNILGGAIIYVVVAALVRHLILPPFLHLFFGIFIGAIQAFVFTLLALTYIGILAAPDEPEEEIIEEAA